MNGKLFNAEKTPINKYFKDMINVYKNEKSNITKIFTFINEEGSVKFILFSDNMPD